MILCVSAEYYMAYNVKINNDNMQVFYSGGNMLISGYRIGDGLLEFAYFDKDEFKELFYGLLNAARYMKDFTFSELLVKIKKENVYLVYFIELYFEYMQQDGITLKKSFEDFRKRFSKECQTVISQEKNTPPAQLMQNCVKKTILLHANTMQEYVKSHFEYCVTGNASLTPLQRFYLYEKWGTNNNVQPIYWEKNPFISKLEASGNFAVANEDLKAAESRMLLLKAEVAQTYSLSNAWSLIRFELIMLIKQDFSAKICTNCGRYFIPEGRVDSAYCTRPILNDPSKTCASIGAMVKYQNKISDKPAYAMYTKTYKRLNSRVRLNKMTKEDFSAWSKKARKMRDKVLNGKLPVEEFEKWLQTF